MLLVVKDCKTDFVHKRIVNRNLPPSSHTRAVLCQIEARVISLQEKMNPPAMKQEVRHCNAV